MAGTFRTTVWDPALIIGQIIVLQSSFYTAMSILIFLWSLSNGGNPSLTHLFSILPANKPMVFVQFFAILCSALLLPVIVGRARQCLDFSVTLHLIHLLIVSLYNLTIPTHFSWWLLQVISCSIYTLLGEWLCQRKEQAEIPLNSTQKQSQSRS